MRRRTVTFRTSWHGDSETSSSSSIEPHTSLFSQWKKGERVDLDEEGSRQDETKRQSRASISSIRHRKPSQTSRRDTQGVEENTSRRRKTQAKVSSSRPATLVDRKASKGANPVGVDQQAHGEEEKEKEGEERQGEVVSFRRLTVDKHSPHLLQALSNAQGANFLKRLSSSRRSTIVNGPQGVLSPNPFSSRRASIAKGALEQDEPRDSSMAQIDKARKVSSIKAKVQKRAKLVGQMAVVVKNYRQASEERLRKLRLKRRWDIVRRICKAFMAVQSILSSQAADDSSSFALKFTDYERLRACLLQETEMRSFADLGFLAEELGKLKVFRDYGVNYRERYLLGQKASLVALPPKKALFHQGDKGDFYYVVLFGTVSVQVKDQFTLVHKEKETEREKGRRSRYSSMSIRRQPARPSTSSLYHSFHRPSKRRTRLSQTSLDDEDEEEVCKKTKAKKDIALDQRFFNSRADLLTNERNHRKLRSRNSMTGKSQKMRGGSLTIMGDDHDEDEDDDVVRNTVVKYCAGDGFGGLSIRREPHTPRKASVVAETAVELLRIDAKDYREIILKYEEDRLNGPLRFLQAIPVFASILDADELLQLAWNASVKRLPLGSLVAQQGKVVSDSEYFGILRIGRCRVFKQVRPNGSEIPLSDLRDDADELENDVDTPSTTTDQTDHKSSDNGNEKKIDLYNAGGGGEEGNQEQESKKEEDGSGSEEGAATMASKSQRTQDEPYWYYFGAKSTGDILSYQSILGENASRHHSVSIVAETCVEIVYIPRNSLHFALRKGDKLDKLRTTLPNYATKDRLKELVKQDQLWKRFQKRFILSLLQETERGRSLLKRIQDVEREQEQQAKEKEREKAKELRTKELEKRRKQKLLQKQEALTEHLKAARPAMISLLDLEDDEEESQINV